MTTKKVEQVVDEAAKDGGFSKEEAEAIKAAAEDTPTPDVPGDPDAGDPPMESEDHKDPEPQPDEEAVKLAEEKAAQNAAMKAKPKSKAARKKAAAMEGPTAAGRTGNYVPADSPEYAARRAAVSGGRANYIPAE